MYKNHNGYTLMHFAIHAFVIRVYSVRSSFRLSLDLLKKVMSVMTVIIILIMKGPVVIVTRLINIIRIRVKSSKVTGN